MILATRKVRLICLKTFACIWCVAILLLLARNPLLHAETVVLDFDPPTFQSGQVLGWVGNIGFLGNATVFQPIGVSTQTPPFALRTDQWCESAACSNGGHVLSIIFKKKAAEVSLRVGSEPTPATNSFCFPEATDCGVYARLIGLDGNTVIVDTRDVELFNAFSVDGLSSPITKELKVSDQYGRISGIMLFVGKGTFIHDINNPGRAQIDSLRVKFLDGPASPPPLPLPLPTVQILEPSTPISFPYRFRIEGTWTAPAGLYALCVRVNEPIPTLNQFCRNDTVLDASSSRFSVELSRDTLLPTGNVVSVGIVDLLGRKVTATLPLLVQAPPPPGIQIWSPTKGLWNLPSPTSLSLSGSTWVPGGLRGFCVQIASATSPLPAPSVDACRDTHYVGPNGTFTGISLDQSKLQPGDNDITVYVFDDWGREAHTSVRGTIPANLRVNGVEITQGSQTFDIRGTSGPYGGAELVRGVPTIVRVFASADLGGPFPNVNATLQGFVPDVRLGEKSLGTILPDNGRRTITTGPRSTPLADRAQSNTAYVFSLPLSWTGQSGLRLRATVNDPAFTATATECVGCGTDNAIDVTQINFKEPLGLQVISPVAIRWHNSSGVAQDPPPSSVVFADFSAMAPLPPSRLLVRPYVTIIDASKSIRQWGILPNGTCDDGCAAEVFRLVAGFERNNQPGFTIGITTADIRGWTAPVTYARPPLVAWELVAIASTTDLKLSVAHELLHQFGFLHASDACGGAGQLFKPWPPDFTGRLQGIGLDRRVGSGPTPGTYAVFSDGPAPATAFDVMSYCANDLVPPAPPPSAWLSSQYWNDFGKTFTFSTAAVCLAGCPQFSSPSDAVSGYRVMALKHKDDGWSIINVTRSLLPRSPSRRIKSKFQFIGKDKVGKILTSVHVEAVPMADQPGVQVITADLPAGPLQTIDLVSGGKVLASRRSSRSSPSITMNSAVIVSDDSDGSTVDVKWSANDADKDSLTIRVEYSDDDGVTYRVVGISSSSEGMELPRRLFSSARAARVRLTVNDGFREATVVSDPFVWSGDPPTVSITEPSHDVFVLSTATINLVGMGFDDRALPVPRDSMEWAVDGHAFSVGQEAVLPRQQVGEHIIELKVRDRTARSAIARRKITIIDGGIEPIERLR